MEYLEEYLEEQIFRGITRKAKNVKRSNIYRYFEYLGENGLRVIDIGIKQAQSFQGWLLEKQHSKGGKYKRSTINRVITEVISFYEFLKRTGKVIVNPFKEIRRLKGDKSVPKNILKEKDMSRLLDELLMYGKEKGMFKKKTRYKLHVIAELMYATGIRIGEASYLKVSDLDLEKGTVKVYEPKTKRRRLCFLNEYAHKVLKLYVEKMRDNILQVNSLNHGSLFGVNGESLGYLFNKELKKVCNSLSLPELTSHSFRHSMGYHLLRAGCDIRYIQELLGHKRLKNTQIYTRVDKDDLREVVDKYLPRSIRSKDEA